MLPLNSYVARRHSDQSKPLTVVKSYVVDCSAVTTFADFISAFNAGFCSLIDGEWSGNMDAFDDYLSWPTEPQYTLRILVPTPVARLSVIKPTLACWRTSSRSVPQQPDCHSQASQRRTPRPRTYTL